MSKNWKTNAKKRNNSYYSANFKRKKTENELTAGVKGFMLTCNQKERECLREAYNILDEYYEKMYEKHDETVNCDFDKQLEDEINEMRIKPKRFKQLFVNCRNIVFVQPPDEVDPLEVTQQIIKDIRAEKSQKTRHLLRFIPIVQTCKFDDDSIRSTMRDLLSTRSDELVEYMVVCKVRNNSDASSTYLIEMVASIVRQEKPQWRVTFDNPTLTISLDVICKICCFSFLIDFAKNKKYNLTELSHFVMKENESEDEVKVKEETDETKKDIVELPKAESEASVIDNSVKGIETKTELEQDTNDETSECVSSVNKVSECKEKNMKIHIEIPDNTDVKH